MMKLFKNGIINAQYDENSIGRNTHAPSTCIQIVKNLLVGEAVPSKTKSGVSCI